MEDLLFHIGIPDIYAFPDTNDVVHQYRILSMWHGIIGPSVHSLIQIMFLKKHLQVQINGLMIRGLS